MYRNFLKTKKRDFYQEKLRGNVGKSKELWKALKSLGLPSKSLKFVSKMGKQFHLMEKQLIIPSRIFTLI